MTIGDKIRNMPNDELAVILPCPYEITELYCKHTADDVHCTECIKEWLESEAEEIEQKKRPPVPPKIDMDNFDNQLSSLSIKAIVQNMKHLASKQNKIIEYLQSLEPKEGENE